MKAFMCAVFVAMVASTLATVPIGTTLIGSNLGLGLGGIAPIGTIGLGGIAPISTYGLGYNTLLNRGLIAPTLLNRGLIAPAPLGLGLRANSLLLPQSRIISAPLIAPAPLSKTLLWK